jgi:hypothetical protein
MKITIHASLDFKDKMLASKRYFEQFNECEVILPELERYQYIRDEYGDDIKFTEIKNKLTKQNIKNVEIADSLLILNYPHRGYENYIGGNSFLEMVIAFYLGKTIYLLNEIPKNMPYTEEIKALKPIVIGSLDNLAENYLSLSKNIK